MAAMSAIGSLFCKSRRSRCVFPFEFDGVEYHECAQREGVDGFPWCAIAVNGLGQVIDGYWARCEMESCTEGETGEFNADDWWSWDLKEMLD